MTNNNIINNMKKIASRVLEEDKRIGRNIKLLRLCSGMSQFTFAKEVGVSGQQLAKYENGENRISAGRLLILAQVLGVDIATIYEERIISQSSHADSKLFEYLSRIEDSIKLQRELYKVIRTISKSSK